MLTPALISDNAPLKPGSTYKLVVRSAEEAVQTIRDRLGENVRVLSVRRLESEGLAGLFMRPKLEVIAQIPELPAMPDALSVPGVITGVIPYTSENPERMNEMSDRAPLDRRDVPVALPDLLKRSGFSPALIGRLEGASALSGAARRPLHHSLVDVGTALRQAATRKTQRLLPERTAFLGTPGVGRTTALCKWLARDVFSRRRTGRVVKTEFDRPNPADGLAVFCEALGLCLEHVTPGMPMEPAAGDFIYMDMPALSARTRVENRAAARFLDAEKIDGRVLVLNAAYDLAMLRDAYAAGRDMGATHLVFTHLDELSHWGKLWDFLIDGELSPLFLSTGPGLTGDMDEDVVGAILRKTLPGSGTPHLS